MKEPVGDELERAREALAAGDADSALVLLWKALEPARLAGDESTLGEISALAGTIPGRDAQDLVKATGVAPEAARPAWEEPAPPARSPLARVLWLVVLLVLVAMIGLAYARGNSKIQQARPAGVDPARITIDADGLYLVPLGRYSASELEDVGVSVIRQAGAVSFPASVAMGPTTYDVERRQFVAEDLLQRLVDTYGIAAGRRVLVVGVTSFDMYEREHPEAPSAPVARTPDGRYVVVSTQSFREGTEERKRDLRSVLLDEIRRVGIQPPG
jgi:hypothetical protein